MLLLPQARHCSCAVSSCAVFPFERCLLHVGTFEVHVMSRKCGLSLHLTWMQHPCMQCSLRLQAMSVKPLVLLLYLQSTCHVNLGPKSEEVEGRG